ncbi:MAG: reprolysin-like metallopeptidase, partial [Bacteroidota bacterium]
MHLILRPLLLLLTPLLCCLYLPNLSAQQNDTNSLIWTELNNTQQRSLGAPRLQVERYKSFSLQINALQNILRSAPQESRTTPRSSTILLDLPLPNGQFETFRLVNSPIMAPELANRYPQIQTYLAIGLNDAAIRARIDWTERGFHAMIQHPEGVTFIDPYSRADVKNYIVYFKKDYRPAHKQAFRCDVEGQVNESIDHLHGSRFGDCQIRSYRLAVATTGEYSNYHGATSSAQSGLVLSAVVTSVNRINQVYEIDLGLRMVLIGNTDQVFYYNAATDPFNPSNMGSFLSQNRSNMSSVIGNANFDIGHGFAQGSSNSGLANLAVICSNNKAGGVTRMVQPEGDPFDIDYTSHEMGHQFGGNHTQNNNCNRVSSASYEPGSASTIMGYAGICSPNVQGNSDDYFHAISLTEMSAHITNSGGTCATIVSTGNQAPTVSAGADYTIPISTPFELTAIASDPDSDPLTYCWEQWDRQVATMPPSSSSTTGPAFRSIQPSNNPTRTFPNLNDLVNNVSPTWEVLPSVSRNLNFIITVRDNAAGGGCTDEDLMLVNSSNTAGPFLVNSPNTAVVWGVGTTETIS